MGFLKWICYTGVHVALSLKDRRRMVTKRYSRLKLYQIQVNQLYGLEPSNWYSYSISLVHDIKILFPNAPKKVEIFFEIFL